MHMGGEGGGNLGVILVQVCEPVFLNITILVSELNI